MKYQNISMCLLLLLLLSANMSFSASDTRSVTAFPIVTAVDTDNIIISDTSAGGAFAKTSPANLRGAMGIGTADNPSFASVHASGGNLAAANAQVTKKWITGLPYTIDVTSVIHGGHHFICTSSHTAGSTTEPGVGASWATVWKYSGEVLQTVRSTASGGDTAVSPSEAAVGDALADKQNVADVVEITAGAGLVYDAETSTLHVAAVTNRKSGNYTIGTDNPDEMYGGIIFVDAAATITADAVAERQNFCVDTEGDIAVSLDVQAADNMSLDGTVLSDGDKATNTSKSGDTICCAYRSADGFRCWSGTVLGGHWTDGN